MVCPGLEPVVHMGLQRARIRSVDNACNVYRQSKRSNHTEEQFVRPATRTHPFPRKRKGIRLPCAFRVKALNIDAEQAIADMAAGDLNLDDLMLLIEPGSM